MFNRWVRCAVVVGTLAAGLGTGAPARAEDAKDASAMKDVLAILKREGMIDEAGEQKILAKHAVEKKSDIPKFLDGLEITGDLRLRYEPFFFDDDALGNESDNRYRFRYRARFGVTKKINDMVKVGFRLATGVAGGDLRSTNVSFGEGGDDEFAPDDIFFDRAFVEFKLQDSKMMQTKLIAGKVANPYVGKVGPDFVVFDNDINMEGAHLTTNFNLSEDSKIYATLGSFVIDEDSNEADPSLYGGQLGFETKTGGVSLGIRASGYQYRSLDSNELANGIGAFQNRAFMSGNLSSAFDRGKARLGETFAYVQFNMSEDFPLLVYGTAVKNLTADSDVLSVTSGGVTRLFDVDEEDMAYGFGFELGNASKFVKIGLGYFRVEANSVIGQFTDSDLFDGFTNRKGFVLYASRKVGQNTEFRLTAFDGDDIEDDGLNVGPFAPSLANADRQRFQADVIFSY